MSSLADIRAAVLQLPSSERAELAGDLLASLEDAAPDATSEAAWAAEILARSDAYRRGEAIARDWRESLDRVRQIVEARGQTP